MPEIRVDGMAVQAAEGVTLAVALLAAGRMRFRTSVSGQPRGPLCGMGVCMECRLSIDGEKHRLACQVVVREGMEVVT
jgi:hypothetical protein